MRYISLDDFKYYMSVIEGSRYIDYADDLVNALIYLLEKTTEDEAQWIRYFIFENDFGRNYVEDQFPCLRTVDDLYELLLRQYYETPKKRNSKLFR